LLKIRKEEKKTQRRTGAGRKSGKITGTAKNHSSGRGERYPKKRNRRKKGTKKESSLGINNTSKGSEKWPGVYCTPYA